MALPSGLSCRYPPVGGCGCAFGGFRQTRDPIENTIMLIGLILFSVAAILTAMLLIRLAVHALPAYCAYLAGQAVQSSGAGLVAAIAAAALAAIATFALAQILHAIASSPATRIVVGLAFAVPAGLAGYHAMHGIAVAVMPESVWQQVLPVVAAVAIAAMAWLRFGAAPSERR